MIIKYHAVLFSKNNKSKSLTSPDDAIARAIVYARA